MVVVDVYNSRFHRVYVDRENLNLILDRDDIFVYEYPQGDDIINVSVYLREETWAEFAQLVIVTVAVAATRNVLTGALPSLIVQMSWCAVFQHLLHPALSSAVWSAYDSCYSQAVQLFCHLPSHPRQGTVSMPLSPLYICNPTYTHVLSSCYTCTQYVQFCSEVSVYRISLKYFRPRLASA